MSAGDRQPYGAWSSPISAAEVAAGGLRLSEIRIAGEDVFWVEGRPAEGGRCVIVRAGADLEITDMIPPPYSARSGVHEYGGGAVEVTAGAIYFTNQSDQRIYRLEPGGPAEPITLSGPIRHADMRTIAGTDRLITVVEEHRPDAVLNRVITLPIGPGDPTYVASGSDFYASPRPSPDGASVAWLQWDQPSMPWDGCELWIAQMSPDGTPTGARRVAGGADESVFQPEWSPDGVLHFISDRTGWWNIYSWDGVDSAAVAPMEAECGRPMWVFGMSTYAFVGADRIALCACTAGTWDLMLVERATGATTPVPLPFTEMGHYIRATGSSIVLDAGGPESPTAIVSIDIDSGRHRTIRRSSDVAIPAASVSAFQRLDFPAADGATGHGFLYRPRSASVQRDARERPPLLVRAHGGPTSAAGTALDPVVQYWTTRGFAVLDVNYGGSTGYGRVYRQRLKGMWGVVDVQDCVDAAVHLVSQGEVDSARLLITGGSAGGYVVLCALTFHNTFAAGASHYGVADAEALAVETHKFEARYLDGLIGPYPECRELYRQRSPVRFIDRVSAPIILFQGMDDAVVPAGQAEAMFSALKSQGIPCALVAFEGEQHGFRRQATIQRVLEAELEFYCRALGIRRVDGVEPVRIENAHPLPAPPEVEGSGAA